MTVGVTEGSGDAGHRADLRNVDKNVIGRP